MYVGECNRAECTFNHNPASVSAGKRHGVIKNVLGNRHIGAPFCLHAYMSRRRFEAILKHLKFTNSQPPAFKHPFHPVNELIVAFNEHSQSCFSPGWVNCLDESMSVWTNQWTCPGWMFVPRKPHPMGNVLYHSLCCGLSCVMYAIEVVEGKDRPRQLLPPKYKEHGKTTALLLRSTDSIAHSGSKLSWTVVSVF